MILMATVAGEQSANLGGMEFHTARSFAPIGVLVPFKPLLYGLVERL